MGSNSYFGVHRGGRVILPSLHQPSVTTMVSSYGKLPQWSSAYPKLQSLTRRGYNVTRLQEPSRKYSVGHAAGLTSIEHAFQPIDNKRFASAWAEVRAGHAIPRLRDATAEQRPAGSTRSLADQSRTDAAAAADSPGSNGARRPPGGGGASYDPSTTSDGASSRHLQPSRARQQQQLSESSGRSRRTGERLPPLSGDESATLRRSSAAALSKGTSGSRWTATDSESTATEAAAKAGELPGRWRPRRQPQPQPQQQPPPPRQVVPRREAQRYMHAKLAYLVEYDADKRRRKEKFMNQLRSVVERVADLHNRALENLEARRRDAIERQQRQLLELRDRFDGERRARLRRQHVSRNALLGLEGAGASRAQYGLPEHFAIRAVMPAAAQSTDAQSTRQRRRGGGRRRRRTASSLSSSSTSGTERFDEQSVDRMHSRLSHRYERLFSIAPAPTFNPRAVTPKLEGYDTVEVTTLSKKGGTKKKRVLAEDVVKDAVSALKAADVTAMSEKNTENQQPAATAAGRAGGVTSRLSAASANDDDADNDEEEIFERLFRKYNIIIEDD